MGAGGNQLREVCDVFCTCQKYELGDQLRVKSIAGGGVDSNGEKPDQPHIPQPFLLSSFKQTRTNS